MRKDGKIYVAGHGGLVGSAIVRKLKEKGYSNIIGRRSNELDLTRQADTEAFFAAEKPDYVFMCAAKVGGIYGNASYPADFISKNLMMETNVIQAAFQNHVKKLMFMGSSCIYPREAPMPLKEEYLLTGALETTNRPYALAKLAGIELCESYNRQYGTNYISCLPSNLYGPGDNFDLENGHVLPSLLRKFVEAVESGSPSVTIWGTGAPYREFLHVDDMADACVFLMEHYDADKLEKNDPFARETVNVGSGKDITIKELAGILAEVTGFKGELVWDTSKPDGTPRKIVDSSKLFNMGWRPKIALRDGVRETYLDYLANRDKYRS